MKPSKLDKLLLHLEDQPSKDLDCRIAALIRQAAKKGSSPVFPELVIWRRIMQNRYTKIAIAAVFIGGCLFLTRHLMGSDTALTSQPSIVKQIDPKETQLRELALAQTLYEQKDLPGLLTLLKTGQYSTRLTISEFLAEMGDASAIPVLHRLADVWQGPIDGNPFLQAIDQISRRLQGDQETIEVNQTPVASDLSEVV
jgi:hypothetical protein